MVFGGPILKYMTYGVLTRAYDMIPPKNVVHFRITFYLPHNNFCSFSSILKLHAFHDVLKFGVIASQRPKIFV